MEDSSRRVSLVRPDSRLGSVSNSKSSSPAPPDLEYTTNFCSDYIERLKRALPETPEIREFRCQWPDKFRAICFMQLAILIDVPLELFHKFSELDSRGSLPRSAIKRILLRSRLQNTSVLPSSGLSPQFASRLQWLISRLEVSKAFQVEGIFRKAGNFANQRKVSEALLASCERDQLDSFNFDNYSLHEVAGALKACLGQLNCPLLTDKLTPLFIQAAGLWNSSTSAKFSECGTFSGDADRQTESCLKQLAFGKQLKAMRLLVQLLPEVNLDVLKALLSFLRKVVAHESLTRMSAFSLGTIFGPIFVPQILECLENGGERLSLFHSGCLQRCQEAISLATRLIELGEELFLLPVSILQDLHENVKPPVEAVIKITTTTTPRRQAVSEEDSPVTPKAWSPCPGGLFGGAVHGTGSYQNNCSKPAKEEASPIRTSIRFASYDCVDYAKCQISPLHVQNKEDSATTSLASYTSDIDIHGQTKRSKVQTPIIRPL